MVEQEVDLTRTIEERIYEQQEKRIKELSPEEREIEIKKFKIFLGEIYDKIVSILKEYVDLKEEYYVLATNWIIGSYLHSSFNTYPYLFLNAMRGSGKSRMLNLIASLSYKGKVIGSPTEAVLFRTPSGETLCLDEYEGILRKGNEGLRELLNASYKRGMTIRRMKQKKVNGATEQVVEEFEPYRPICIANIWGMEEVLGDRCITLILEKSNRKDIMRIIEDFSTNPVIEWIKKGLEANLVQLCSFFSVVKGIEKWNLYVKSKYSTLYTLTTLTTYNTLTTQENNAKSLTLTQKDLELFNKIDETGINGRNLELFFPLLTIGNFISEENFNCILKVASDLTKEKREEEMVESKDVSVYDFVASQNTSFEYKSIRILTNNFRNFIGNENDKQEMWLNEKWFGRALKRLNLILDKRRVAGGIQVTLNSKKAKEKMFEFGSGLNKNDNRESVNNKELLLNNLKVNLDKIISIDDLKVIIPDEEQLISNLNALQKEGLIYSPKENYFQYLG